jgi:hypothetical protein
MNDKIYIKTTRQQKTVQILIENTEIAVKDLIPLTGALNPPQTISELRKQGFHGIIITRFYEVIDQDGKRCRPGKYFIPLSLKPIAEQALNEYNSRPRARCTEKKKKLTRVNNSGEE